MIAPVLPLAQFYDDIRHESEKFSEVGSKKPSF